MQFEIYDVDHWRPVKYSDKAVPLSALNQTFFHDIDIQLNQTRITNSINYAQIGHILSHFSTNYHYQTTLGYTSGYSDDITDPDSFSEQNSGFKIRQNIFCKPDDVVNFEVQSVPIYVC